MNKQVLTFLPAFAAWKANVANAQTALTDSFPDNEPIYMDMKLTEGDKVQIEVVTRTDTWFGILLGDSRMRTGNDLIQFSADGDNSYCVDTVSRGHYPPNHDTQQNVTCET